MNDDFKKSAKIATTQVIFQGRVGDFEEQASFESIRSPPPCKTLSKATPPQTHDQAQAEQRLTSNTIRDGIGGGLKAMLSYY